MRRAAVPVSLLLSSILLLADDHHVDFDADFDFSLIRTFAIREGQINSPKPELNNRLFVQKLGETIRKELAAKGLKENTDRADLYVDFSIVGKDFSTVERHPATRIPDEGTLVIDMTNKPGVLLWRGVYRDEESSGPMLAQKLPGDAKELLAEYPPRKKK